MPKTFGEILKSVREKQNLKQKDFAKILGVNQSTYSKYENGEMKRGDTIIETIYRIYNIYNIEPNELLDIKSSIISDTGTASYYDYKSEIFHKLIKLNEEIEATDYDELKEIRNTIIIKDTGLRFEIEYKGEQLVILKDSKFDIITTVSIVTQFISEMLNRMETVIEKEKFDERLIRSYIGYKDIVKEYFRM